MEITGRHIVLIGPPGAGKSNVGRKIAEYIGRDFVDIDDEIVRHAGVARLRDVLDQLGDEAFIAREGEVAAAVLEGLKQPTIIGTGGSIVYAESVMELLGKTGLIVYLQAPLKKIERKVKDPRARAVVMNGCASLKELLEQRGPLYKRFANLVVKADGKHGEVARRLQQRLVHGGIPIH